MTDMTQLPALNLEETKQSKPANKRHIASFASMRHGFVIDASCTFQGVMLLLAIGNQANDCAGGPLKLWGTSRATHSITVALWSKPLWLQCLQTYQPTSRTTSRTLEGER